MDWETFLIIIRDQAVIEPIRSHGNLGRTGVTTKDTGGSTVMRISARESWVAAVVMVLAASWASAQDLASEISRLINSAKIGDAVVGVSVLDLSDGRIVASRAVTESNGEHRLLIPASNMKLFTTGAALVALGQDFRFRTELRLSGDRLVLIGSGDPALADPSLLSSLQPSMNVEDFIGVLVKSVRQAGIDSIREIVVDDRVFDDQRVHPEWPRDQLVERYCAEVSGLNFYTNVIDLFASPSPSGAGSPVTVRLEPRADWISLDVQARTVDTGTSGISIRRDPHDNRFVVTGQVRLGQSAGRQVSVVDPAVVMGQLLADRLAKQGVRIGSRGLPLTAVRRAAPGDSFPADRTLAVVTTGLPEVLRRCNSDSSNLYAEALLKRLGHEMTGGEPGSWTNGAAAINMWVVQLAGAEYGSSIQVADGSGLSRGNRVSPELVVRWLAAIERRPESTLFIESLATVGTGTGTLRHRFREAQPINTLRAKTGMINGVRALSGYLTHPTTGQRVAFSILANDLKTDAADQAARNLSEQIVLAIDRWLSRQAEFARVDIGG